MPAALSLSPNRSWRASAPASYEKQVPTTSKTTEGIFEKKEKGRTVEKVRVRVRLMEREIQTRSIGGTGGLSDSSDPCQPRPSPGPRPTSRSDLIKGSSPQSGALDNHVVASSDILRLPAPAIDSRHGLKPSANDIRDASQRAEIDRR